jgi:hypothetical protein
MAKTPRRKKNSPAPSAPATQPRAKEHPLVDAGLHFKDEHGRVKNQGTIAAVIPSNNHNVGDLVLVQYFDWVMGFPSTRRLVPLSELTTDNWVLYESIKQMTDHYERTDGPRNDAINARLDAEAKRAKAEDADQPPTAPD